MVTRARHPTPKPPSKALVPVSATEDPIPRPPHLTEMQHAFALAYVQNGDGNAARAARDAGYTAASAQVTGYRLLHRGDVLAHIRDLTTVLLASTAPLAAMTMRKLALSARSELVRQHAAKDILDRAGFRPPEQHQHLVSGAVTISIDLGD